MDGGLSGHSINIHYVVITALGWAGGLPTLLGFGVQMLKPPLSWTLLLDTRLDPSDSSL